VTVSYPGGTELDARYIGDDILYYVYCLPWIQNTVEQTVRWYPSLWFGPPEEVS